MNVIDGSIPSSLPEGAIDGQLYAGGTTVDDGTQFAGRAKTALGNFVFQIEGLRRDAGDVSIPGFAKSDDLRAEEFAADPLGFEEGPEGVITNTAFDFTVYGGGAAVVGDWGFIGLSAREFESNYGLPLEDEDEVGIEMEQTRIDARGEFNVNLGPFQTANFSAGYVDYQHGENALSELQTLFENEGYEFRGALVNGEAGELWNGSAGVQFIQQDFSATGAEDFIPPAETIDYGIFGAQRYDKGSYGFEAGLRYETREVSPLIGEELNFDSISGSGGAFFRPNEAIFTGFTVSHTERAPTNAELFSDGFHPATGTFEIGNTDLEKETAWSLETVINADGEGWKIEGAAYYTIFDDFIFLAGTGVDVPTDPGETAPEFRYFQDDANFLGFELYGETDIVDFGLAKLRADATVEFVHGETSDLGPVPFIPPLSAILGTTLVGEKWQLRGDVELVDNASNQADFELPTDGYTLVDLQARVKPFDSKDLTLIFGAENIFDVEARLNTSQLKDFVPLPGRNFRASIAIGF